jgi:hypothetical protein
MNTNIPMNKKRVSCFRAIGETCLPVEFAEETAFSPEIRLSDASKISGRCGAVNSSSAEDARQSPDSTINLSVPGRKGSSSALTRHPGEGIAEAHHSTEAENGPFQEFARGSTSGT